VCGTSAVGWIPDGRAYLQPSKKHLANRPLLHPEEFREIRAYGRRSVLVGRVSTTVRSSYHAAEACASPDTVIASCTEMVRNVCQGFFIWTNGTFVGVVDSGNFSLRLAAIGTPNGP